MELQGTIKKISDIQTFESGFQKREVVILTDETYPQPINIEFLSDKVDLIDSYKVGDSVKIGINIRGREWVSPQGETKYFNSIVGWRVEKADGAKNEPVKSGSTKKKSIQEELEEADDALPF